MESHDKLRTRIDDIDRELVELFEARMRVSSEIAEYKQKNDIPIFDEAREEEVVEKNVGRLTDKTLERHADSFFRHLMALSRKRQHENHKNYKSPINNI
ncbi:chorismate mutase [Salinicoccus carnicancri]|uniref:chorismate mutase n=1 Tax=Salinicoccus carnicancri TaxID=558170 RepID=UPI0002E92918|nr:chorismate mutase [Salinicoccus carnicancri]